MKKLFAIIAIAFSISANAQSDTAKCHNPFYMYTSAGISMGAGNFEVNSYPGVEVGAGYENFTMGLAFGRGSLDFSTADRISNYWWEIKQSASMPIGSFNAYGVFGYGSYLDTPNHMFIEYGAGVSYMPKNFGYYVQYSNWDNYNYVSVGVTYMIDFK